MNQQHIDTSPVILLGQGRSGTTITSALLRDYLGVAFGTESQFIPRYYRRLNAYGDLRNDDNLRTLIQHITKERWFERSRKFNDFRTSCDAIYAGVRQRTYRGVLDSVFGQLAKHLQMHRWGDKTPDYLCHLDMMWELFPDAKFIHVARDGRDVALSLRGVSFGPQNLQLAALRWHEQVQAVDRFSKLVPNNQFRTVRYEDLIRNPVDTFAVLIRFLESENANSDVHMSLQHALPSRLKQGNHSKWRSQLTPQEVAKFDLIACGSLSLLGYESSVSEPAPAPGFGQRAIWSCQSKLALWRRREYWREHCHSVRTRSFDALRSMRLTGQR